MSSPLYFKIKNGVDAEKHLFLELFFKDWVDDNCDRQVHYRVERKPEITSATGHYDIFRVDFEKQEDALIVMLKGIPEEFQEYLEIVDAR